MSVTAAFLWHACSSSNARLHVQSDMFQIPAQQNVALHRKCQYRQQGHSCARVLDCATVLCWGRSMLTNSINAPFTPGSGHYTGDAEKGGNTRLVPGAHSTATTGPNATATTDAPVAPRTGVAAA